MKPLKFTIPGKPQPKERPRATRSGRVYTPPRTRDYEKFVGAHCEDALDEYEYPWHNHEDGEDYSEQWPTGERYEVELWLYFPDKKRRDLDNVAKAICDGMNGFAYDDDSQVDKLVVHRCFDRGNSRAEVEVRVI